MQVMKKISAILLLLLLVTTAFAQDKPATKNKDTKAVKQEEEAKELSGISIVGNKEAPKSLFIVPWKSSELGVETGLASSLLNEKLKPVDKDVFARELDFYSISVGE